MSKILSFATFAECLLNVMQEPYDRKKVLTELLFEFLISPNEKTSVRNRKGDILTVDEKMASNLFKRKTNVHKGIKANCDNKLVIQGISKYFEKNIIPYISKPLINDLIKNIMDLIRYDNTISEAMKNEIYCKEQEGIGSLLSYVFIYSLKRENKCMNNNSASDEILILNANKQYYNSFMDTLFLHKNPNCRSVSLKDLFVMPLFKECYWNNTEEYSEELLQFISRFVKDENEGNKKMLFIEGDAGVGKTSLVSFLSYLYIDNPIEWKKLFLENKILCIRLRDIIPTNMKFSSDVITRDIINYLNLSTIQEFDRLYGSCFIIFDGFDELCMIEGINNNLEQYIYQIYEAFKRYKIIITTRPQYLDIYRLDIPKRHIKLQHFNAEQRLKWIEKYEKLGISDIEKKGIEYIVNIGDEEVNSICDTPMVLYMIVAGGIDEEAKNNLWVLYHQIFFKELADTEYNSMFPSNTGIYSHSIKKHKDILYRLSSEISYKMFCKKNLKLYLSEQEIRDIVSNMGFDQIEVKLLAQKCYALCNYWKVNEEKGAVEFYHNNIRDFFLCEKLFYELNSMYRELTNLDELNEISGINNFLYDLLKHMKIPQKTIEFLYLRTIYNKEHNMLDDFPLYEYRKKYLPHIFTDMLIYGGVSQYERSSNENIYRNMMNLLSNIVQIYRHSYEPYLTDNNGIIWWFNIDKNIANAGILKSNFKEIFIHTPLTLDNYIMIHLCGKAYFDNIALDCIDLRYADFTGSSLENVNFNNSIITSATFENSNLKNATFVSSDLSNSSLVGCCLEGVEFKDAILINTILPDGFYSDDQQSQLNHLRKLDIKGLKV